jgi:hypothetical protein
MSQRGTPPMRPHTTSDVIMRTFCLGPTPRDDRQVNRVSTPGSTKSKSRAEGTPEVCGFVLRGSLRLKESILRPELRFCVLLMSLLKCGR